MNRRGEARGRREAGEPRWAETANDEAPPASGPFANTYAAIAAADGRTRRRSRRRRPLLALLAIGAAAALALPLLGGRAKWQVARQPVARPAAPPTAPRVASPSAPEVVDAAPSRAKTRLRVDEPGDFAVVARGGNLRYGWTLDGRAAGTGPRWVWTPEVGDVGTHTVAVTVLGPAGAVTREWTVRVQPAPPTSAPPRSAEGRTAAPEIAIPPPPAPAARTAPPEPVRPPAVAAEPPPRVASRTEDDAPRAADARRRRGAPPDRTARAESPRGTTADVRRWLARWAAAWNAHDVDALRQMGQMATASDAEAVRRYLAQVTDLEVSVNVVAMREEGDTVVVRFVRRDRFRDPAGRLVEHESPPIEKTLVRSGNGFRVVANRS